MSSEKEVTLCNELGDPSNTPQSRKNYPDVELQILRRSTRKSIKPLQDYFEIIQMNLRSSSKRVHTSKTNEENIKWTPAKVGRVSQKRKRKNRKLDTTKKFENIRKVQKDENELKNNYNEDVTIENNNLKLDEFNRTDLRIHPLQNVLEESICNIEKSELKCTKDARNALETLNIIQDYNDFKEHESIDLGKSIKDDSKKINQCFEMNKGNQNVDVLSTSPRNSTNEKISMENEENIMLRLIVSDDENEHDLVIPKSQTSKSLTNFTKRPIPYCFSNENVDNMNLKFRQKDTKFNNINDTSVNVDQIINTKKAKITIPVTTLQPKDIILRSIRKRSLLVCNDEAKEQRKLLSKNKVTFNSPANQVAIVGVLDEHTTLDIQKKKDAVTLPSESYITKRKKRSMSSEQISNNGVKKDISLNSNLVKIIPASSEKTKNLTPVMVPLMRKKMPNFSAIHQNQFKKMENLVEHVARKAERAKTLINSAAKLSTASAKKTTNVSTNANLNQCKPKMARKLICNNNDFTSNARPTTTAKTTLKLKIPNTKNSNNTSFEKHSMNENKNFNNESLAYIKPLAVIEPTQSANQQHTNQKITNLDKKRLHLSTKKNLPSNNISSELREKLISDLPIPTHEHLKNNKFSERSQRHMEMFKERKTVKLQKQKEYLRGVRSNRRFELQMLHRQNLSLNK